MEWYEKGAFKHFAFNDVDTVKKDQKVVGKCKLCPGNVSISGRLSVSSNFQVVGDCW